MSDAVPMKTSLSQAPRQQQFESDSSSGTLNQVVSKYVDPNGPSATIAFEETAVECVVINPKECLLSTQVPYSDESSSSTSAISRFNADTASSLTSAVASNSGLFSLSSEVESTYSDPNSTEVCCQPSATLTMNTTTGRNPDNLESILPPSLLTNREYHSSPLHRNWVWNMPIPITHASVTALHRTTTTFGVDTVTKCDYHHNTWQNLCELPDTVAQFLSFDSTHSNVKQEQLLHQLCETESTVNHWKMNLQGVGKNSESSNPMKDWGASRGCQESTSLAYALTVADTTELCNDLYMLDNVQHAANSTTLQYLLYDDEYLFPRLMEESTLNVWTHEQHQNFGSSLPPLALFRFLIRGGSISTSCVSTWKMFLECVSMEWTCG